MTSFSTGFLATSARSSPACTTSTCSTAPDRREERWSSRSSTNPTFTNKSLVLFTSGSTNLYATKAGTTVVTYSTNFDYCDDDNVSNAYYFRFVVTGSGVGSGNKKETSYDVPVDYVNPVLRVAQN